MDHRSKCKTKTTKLLEENTERNHYDLILCKYVLAMTPKTRSIKENIDEEDFVKIK